MDTVQQGDDDSGFGKTDPKDGGAELERDGGFLLCIVPDDELWYTISIGVSRVSDAICTHFVLRELGIPSSANES